MIFNRRTFFSLLLARPAQATSLQVAVLEKFEMDSGPSAVLVHHANAATRDAFAAWLQTHPKAAVRVRTISGQEVPATVFRVRMCFGRGLIFFEKSVRLQKRDILTLIA
jgi:hypothetical protein